MKQEISTLSERCQPPLLGIPSSAQYLGLTQRSIKNLIYKRQIPVIHMGRRIYLRKIDLDLLIQNGTQE